MNADLALKQRTTALLTTAESADVRTLGELIPLLYGELRDLARRQLARERADHTLNTTGLVHEAYLRLVDDTRVTESGRAYFFAAAARAMRQVLIDYARRRKAAKRGGARQQLPLDEQRIAVETYADELLDLDLALDQLAELNPRYAHVVECRFFGGLSLEETAAALEVSPRTVRYDWELARAWLYNTLKGRAGP